MEAATIRLNKYLAQLGVCSRRECEAFLISNIVTVNGERIAEPGYRVTRKTDVLLINGKKILQPEPVYYLINKPKGFISTTSDEFGRKNVVALLSTEIRVYPVGRLDKDTTGLLLLTNDGELTNQLTHPKYHVDKVYRFHVQGIISTVQLHALRNGVLLDDGLTAPALVTIIQSSKNISLIQMTIHEGRNRQIRRMCETVGLRLLDLERIKFGPLSLSNLKKGSFRKLRREEIQVLRHEVTD